MCKKALPFFLTPVNTFSDYSWWSCSLIIFSLEITTLLKLRWIILSLKSFRNINESWDIANSVDIFIYFFYFSKWIITWRGGVFFATVIVTALQLLCIHFFSALRVFTYCSANKLKLSNYGQTPKIKSFIFIKKKLNVEKSISTLLYCHNETFFFLSSNKGHIPTLKDFSTITSCRSDPQRAKPTQSRVSFTKSCNGGTPFRMLNLCLISPQNIFPAVVINCFLFFFFISDFYPFSFFLFNHEHWP